MNAYISEVGTHKMHYIMGNCFAKMWVRNRGADLPPTSGAHHVTSHVMCPAPVQCVSAHTLGQATMMLALACQMWNREPRAGLWAQPPSLPGIGQGQDMQRAIFGLTCPSPLPALGHSCCGAHGGHLVQWWVAPSILGGWAPCFKMLRGAKLLAPLIPGDSG